MPEEDAKASGRGALTWSERRIVELRRALASCPAGQRASRAARLASLLVASGQDDEAGAVLLEARRLGGQGGGGRDPEGLAALELALAACAIARDDDVEASACLDAAQELSPLTAPAMVAARWLVLARRSRAADEPPVDAPPDLDLTADDRLGPGERAELEGELALERAIWERDVARDPDASRRSLAAAHAIATVSGAIPLVAAIELEGATASARRGDLEAARRSCLSAIERLRAAGLRRDQGRAMIRFGELLASHGGSSESGTPASWLGRAEGVLGASATWRDRLAIHHGIRAYGRRGLDRAMTDGTASGILAFERARGALVNGLTRAGHATGRAWVDLEAELDRNDAPDGQATRSLLDRLAAARRTAAAQGHAAMAAVAGLDASMRGLIEIVGAALFERDRLRMLLGVLAEIDKTSDEASLAPIVASLALPLLDADRVVLGLSRGGELVAVGEAGKAAAGTEADWRTLVESTDGPVSRPSSDVGPRGAQALSGPRIVIPIRGRETRGVLYADRLRRAVEFREQDEAIAHLLAEYLALAFGRLHAREQERFALQKLAVTLDTIRDGVVACDAEGVIVSLNAAAARMLRLAKDGRRDERRDDHRDDHHGVRLESVPELAPLWSMLRATSRLDGTVVRLAQASFVVTARAIASDGEAGRGYVATLVELDRAQKIAQRLSSTRARYGFHDLVGTSAAMTAAVEVARRAASIDANVLILGESGTGKEVIAQAIHTEGSRGSEPFIGVNCAAVPRELLEAELFGYERGAFTGARSDGNVGKFELAAGGTILLDEIGDMPLDMQAKLLRVLQERVVTRLGGRHEVEVHARVIATTHRDLAELVEEGRFRMDLFYRLRVLALEIPPLRERHEDIPLLARHYLARFAEQQRKRLGQLGPRVLEELSRYDWPGNVRELANVMEAEVSLAAPDVDVLERLATRLVGRFRTAGATSTGEFPRLGTMPPTEGPIVPLAEVEKRTILSALERCAGNVSRAADALGVSKVTIYAKLRAWGMHPRDRADEAEGGPTSARASSPRLPGLETPATMPPPSKRSPGRA